MNKYLPLTLSLLALSLTPAIANASSARIGYESVSLSSVSLTGLSVSGSLDISDDFSLELWSGSVDTTVSGLKVQLEATIVGIGYNTKLSTVYGASVEAELTDNVDGLLGFSKSTESGSNMSTMFGISVGVSESMDLTVSSSGNSTLKSTAIGLRYNF